MSRILLRNGRIWDGEGFLTGDVLVEQGKIAGIGEKLASEADLVYDADGRIITPGLVDIHMHMRGISVDQWGTPAELSCIPFGVTAACDVSAAQGDRTLLDTMLVKNRVLLGIPIRQNRPDFAQVEEKKMRYGDKVIGLKVFCDAASSEIENTEPLREIVAYAHARQLFVMVHCNGSPIPMAEILKVLGEGDILTHAYHGGANSAAEDGFESLKEAKMRGVVIDAGMAGHVHTDFEVFRQAVELGILPDVISTDITRASAYHRGGRYGMTMCMSIARSLGMPEEAILKAVTSVAAKAIGMEAQCGSLQVGRTADLAVLSYTEEGFDLTDKAGHRWNSPKGYRCELTMVDGQVVYRH